MIWVQEVKSVKSGTVDFSQGFCKYSVISLVVQEFQLAK